MTFKNGSCVRVKIPGHRTYGVVVETVPAHASSSTTPDRFYTDTKSSAAPTGSARG